MRRHRPSVTEIQAVRPPLYTLMREAHCGDEHPKRPMVEHRGCGDPLDTLRVTEVQRADQPPSCWAWPGCIK